MMGLALAAACSDPGQRACSSQNVVKIVTEHVAEKLAAEMLIEMMATGIRDSSRQATDARADVSGQTKRSLTIENVRTEVYDRDARIAKCSAVAARQYYIEYATGRRDDGDRRSSKVTYTVETADNGNFTVTDIDAP
jgi:hypothetical protein